MNMNESIIPTWIYTVLLVSIFCGTPALAVGDHDDHEEDGDHQHEESHEENIVTLTEDQMKSLSLGSVQVSRGELTERFSFPAEIQFDPMKVAHLTPRVQGTVREVNHVLGDVVKGGSELAVLESRELGVSKSNYLASLALQRLRERTFAREERLWKQQITSEQDYLEAAQALEESRIEVLLARQNLLALGVSEEDLALLGLQGNHLELNRYRMTMPFDGRIIEQHITRGEVLDERDAAFVVADTRSMWVNARVPERDLAQVSEGLEALVTVKSLGGAAFNGRIEYLSSQLDPETRTALARLTLPNPDGLLRAGMFAEVTVLVPRQSATSGGLIVPSAAIQRVKDGQVVFKRMGEGTYESIPVTILRITANAAEVSGELAAGDSLATGDLFILKSQVSKHELGSGHSH